MNATREVQRVRRAARSGVLSGWGDMAEWRGVSSTPFPVGAGSSVHLQPLEKKLRGHEPVGRRGGVVIREPALPVMLYTLALTLSALAVVFRLERPRLSVDFSDLSVSITSDEILDQLCDRPDGR